MANDAGYDKVKHLVEVDDDILAVLIVESGQIRDLYIAKYANIEKSFVETVFEKLRINSKVEIEKIDANVNNIDTLLGNLKWEVLEYDKIRILKIYEKSKIIGVLVKSHTQLEHTVDNILGYYYESDEIPKNLF